MNDEFLTQFREAPRAEFSDALHNRISQQSQPHIPWKIVNKLTFRTAATMFVLMLLVAACVYAVTETPYRKVGGIWFTVQKKETFEVNLAPEMSEEVYVQSMVYECPLSLDEAREILRFDFLVPAWAPEGFTFNDSVCGNSISDLAAFSWKGADGTSHISITVHDLRWFDPVANLYKLREAAVWQPVAPSSYKEVQVNGQPAVLVRGDWKQPEIVSETPDGKLKLESKWDKNLAIQLYWADGPVLYQIYTPSEVSEEDLIKMAESAQ